ncbi:hypothetical protein FA13DRAFT_1727855 [Coprinellus micaceus]|uniref:Uncharacterized protein n=1 Tax=Coprinellus micaceus TaxID=71717 RepID=A0A4Y7TQ26_COPMI|nr:hypothetical protein FA13DRAFT_1727855 [Coprinellus micaceus]
MKRVESELRVCRLDASRVLHLERRDVLVREKEDSREREKEGLAQEKNDLERKNELLTRENEKMAKEKEAHRFALEADVEELRGAVTALNKSKDDAEARVLQQAMGFSELKAKYPRLAERLGGMEKECDHQRQQIQALTQANLKEDLERTNGDLRDKTLELGDKLIPNSPSSSPATPSQCFEIPPPLT